MSVVDKYKKLLTVDNRAAQGEVGTPSTLVNEILNRLPKEIFRSKITTFLDPCFGNGTFLIEVIKRLRAEGHTMENIQKRIYGYEVSHRLYNKVNKLLSNYNFTNLRKEDFLKKDFKDMIFDVTLANPPYKKGLHLKFLDKALSISNRVLFIHPSAWILTKTHGKRATQPEETCIDLIHKYKTNFELINGNKIFSGAVFFYPLIVTDIDKSSPSTSFTVSDSMHGKVLNFKNFKDINLHSSDETFLTLRNKLIDAAKTSNFFSNNKLQEGDFGVTISKIRGSLCRESYFKDDFYTLIPRAAKVVNRENGNDFTFWCETERQAENMLNFLKTDFARFCLSLYKVTNNIKSGSIHKAIPTVDFNETWTDSKLYKHFDITKEEQVYISEVIPPYYDY